MTTAVAAATLATPYETPKKFSGSADDWKFMVTGGSDLYSTLLTTRYLTFIIVLKQVWTCYRSSGAISFSEMAFRVVIILIGFRISIGSIVLAHKAASRVLDQRSSAADVQLFTKLRGPPSEP